MEKYICFDCKKEFTLNVRFKFIKTITYYGCIFCEKYKIFFEKYYDLSHKKTKELLSIATKLGLRKEEYNLINENNIEIITEVDDEKKIIITDKKGFKNFLKDFIMYCGHTKHKNNKNIIGHDYDKITYCSECKFMINNNLVLYKEDIK